MFDIFISHSKQDVLVADAAKHFLERRGIRCWKAPDNILPGQTWEEAIALAITNVRGILLIWSTHSQNSKQVCRELSLAATSEKIIIPYRIELVHPAGTFAYYLTNTHWLDAISDNTEDDLERLSNQIAELLPVQTDDVQNGLTEIQDIEKNDNQPSLTTQNEYAINNEETDKYQPILTPLQPRCLIGVEFLVVIKSMKTDASKTEMAIETGYSNILEDESIEIDLWSFYEALLESTKYTRDHYSDKRIKELYDKAVQSEASGNLVKALTYYTHILSIDPNDSMTYYNRGCALLKMGEYKRAFDDFTNAIRLNPDIDNAYFYRAYAEMEQTRGFPDGSQSRQDAMDDLRHYINTDDDHDHADSYLMLGNAACFLGDYTNAIRYFNRAIDIDPSCSVYYTHRAEAKTYLNDKLGAREDYLKALSLNANDMEAARGLAYVKGYLSRLNA